MVNSGARNLWNLSPSLRGAPPAIATSVALTSGNDERPVEQIYPSQHAHFYEDISGEGEGGWRSLV